MKVVTFVVRRVLRVVLCLWVVSLLTWTLLQFAPGDFASIQAVGGGTVGLAQEATAEQRAGLQARYGDDIPAWQQYTQFMVRSEERRVGKECRSRWSTDR